jgi:hypothetical protein
MMEALQVLKFNHRNGVIDFTAGLVDDPGDLELVTLDEMSDDELAADYRGARGDF